MSHMSDLADEIRTLKANNEAMLRDLCAFQAERDSLRSQLSEAREALRRLTEAVAPAVAVLSRAQEVAPELRAQLADAEVLILGPVRAALSPSPSEALTPADAATLRAEGEALSREIARRTAPMKRGPFGPSPKPPSQRMSPFEHDVTGSPPGVTVINATKVLSYGQQVPGVHMDWSGTTGTAAGRSAEPAPREMTGRCPVIGCDGDPNRYDGSYWEDHLAGHCAVFAGWACRWCAYRTTTSGDMPKHMRYVHRNMRKSAQSSSDGGKP